MPAHSPEELSSKFAAAIRARDIPAAVDLWLEDALIVQADGQTVQGRNAIEAALHALIDNGVAIDIQLDRVFAAGDVAVGVGSLTISGHDGDGHAFEQRSQSTVIYCRDCDGAWRLAIDAPWGLPQTS